MAYEPATARGQAALAEPAAPGGLVSLGGPRALVPVQVGPDRHVHLVALALDRHDGGARRRLVHHQRQPPGGGVGHRAGQGGCARSGHRDPLAHRRGGGDPEGVREPGPRLVAGPRPRRDGERGRGRPAGEVLEVQPEVEQEQLPALDHAVVLVVPLRAGAEAGVHQPHDARAAVAGLDQPLEGQALAALDALEHHPAGRLPGGDAARHLPSRGPDRTMRRPRLPPAPRPCGARTTTRSRGRWRWPATPPPGCREPRPRPRGCGDRRPSAGTFLSCWTLRWRVRTLAARPRGPQRLRDDLAAERPGEQLGIVEAPIAGEAAGRLVVRAYSS